MQHILDVFLRLYFFLTPIFYDASIIPERFRLIYYLNPLTHLVEAYRAILLHGTPPGWLPLIVLGLFSVVFLVLGFKVFIRASYRFAEEI
jgi:ABC-type polysaccharide/polyol phosphate export permease